MRAIVFLFLCFSATMSFGFEITGHNDFVVKITRLNVPPISITLSSTQVEQFEKEPIKLHFFLMQKGIECCQPRKRLSDSVWECCDGTTRIITTNRRLQDIIAKALGGS